MMDAGWRQSLEAGGARAMLKRCRTYPFSMRSLRADASVLFLNVY